MQYWTIADTAGVTVLAAAFPTPSTGSHPKDNGWAWDAAGQKATRIDKLPDLTTQRWSGTAWIEDLAKVRDQLLADVKAEAESRKMALLSPGGAKKTEYSDQAAEVRFFWSLGGTVNAVMTAIGLMPPERRVALFPCAIDNAAEFGDTIDKAIARFAEGMRTSATRSKIAAREQKACAAIKAATTVAAARAAAAVIWPS
jgi:hypothetical protein